MSLFLHYTSLSATDKMCPSLSMHWHVVQLKYANHCQTRFGAFYISLQEWLECFLHTFKSSQAKYTWRRTTRSTLKTLISLYLNRRFKFAYFAMQISFLKAPKKPVFHFHFLAPKMVSFHTYIISA